MSATPISARTQTPAILECSDYNKRVKTESWCFKIRMAFGYWKFDQNTGSGGRKVERSQYLSKISIQRVWVKNSKRNVSKTLRKAMRYSLLNN